MLTPGIFFRLLVDLPFQKLQSQSLSLRHIEMSVKFEKDTIRQTGGIAGAQGSTMSGGRHPIATEVGTALTGGKGNVGAKGYLTVRLRVFFLAIRI